MKRETYICFFKSNTKDQISLLYINKGKRISKGQSRKNNPENTEGAIKKEQSRETGNIGHIRQRKTIISLKC